MSRAPFTARAALACALGFALPGFGLGSGCGASSMVDAPADDELEAGVLAIDPSPPLDFVRSPHTGWTRDHYVSLFARTVHGWSQHLSPGGARARLPGDPNFGEQLEGVTRVLPAFGAWLQNPDNPARFSYAGTDHDIMAYARAIVLHGTDPEHPEYWGPIEGPNNQRNVEALFVADFLWSSKARFWDELTEPERDQIMAWLVATPPHDYRNNWGLIAATRDAIRAELGYPIREDADAERVARFEAHYLGDGWYQDGSEALELDGYNGYIIHPCLMRWAQLRGQRFDQAYPGLAQRVERRARAWLSHLPFMLAADGAAVPIGRSLTYRSAWLLPLVESVRRGDVGPTTAGQARRMLSANLSWHVGATPDAVGRMYDDRDLITWGWLDQDPNAREAYQSPASQYLATSVFGVLALPDEHPFWQATEGSLPADTGSFVHSLPGPGFHLGYDGGVLTFENLRGYKTSTAHHPRFAKLAYASHAPFSVRAPGGSRPVDATLLTSANDSDFPPRSETEAFAIAEGFAWTQHSTATSGPPGIGSGDTPSPRNTVSTATLNAAGMRWRGTCVWGVLREPVHWYEGAFAMAAAELEAEDDAEAGWTYARAGGLSQLLVGLEGYEAPSPWLPWQGADDNNLSHAFEAVSYLRSEATSDPSEPECSVSVQRSSLAPFDPRTTMQAFARGDLSATLTSTELHIQHPHGELRVDLSRSPTEQVWHLGEMMAQGPLRYLRNDTDWIAAHGARRIDDARGRRFESLAPGGGSLSCREGLDDSVECTIDGPAHLRTPDASSCDDWRIEVDAPSGQRSWPGQSEGNTLSLDATQWASWREREESSEMSIRFRRR